jgi:hypothetical protein
MQSNITEETMRSAPLSVLLIAGLAGLCAADNSTAALSSVTLDWSQLKTQVLGIGGNAAPTLTLSGQSTHIAANAFSDGDGSELFDHTVPNWSDTKNYAAHTTHADGSASASSSSIALSTSATPLTICCGSSSGSFVERSAAFSLNGPGAVIVTVPYTLAVTPATPGSFDYSSLNINGSATFSAADSFGSNSSSGSKSIFVDSSSPTSTSGTLTFGLLATAAGTGFLDFSLSTNASTFNGSFVPEPSTLLGLIAGLGAVVVVGSRRIGNA